MVQSLWQDVRYAVRSFRRAPGVVALAVITLALGVGANTAVFSVIDGVVLRPLPYPEPERLGQVWLDNPKKGVEQGLTSRENYQDWRTENAVFTDLAAYVGWGSGAESGDGSAETVSGTMVSANFFSVMGVAPRLGRGFMAGEDERGARKVVVIGESLWRSRFGADPGVIDRAVEIGEATYTVVGVMPDGFEFPKGANAWFPANLQVDPAKSFRANVWLSVVGRLKPGATWDQARGEMAAIGARLAEQYPVENEGTAIALVPLADQISGKAREPLYLLWAAVAVVLLISCANVANILLTRGASRRREIAVRIAIGAGRGRIVRQMLVEGSVIALAGGALGLAVAYWAVSLLLAAGPSFVPRLEEIGVDGRALAFSMLASAATVLLFGLAPAVIVSHVDPQEALRSTGRTTGGGGRGNRFRRALASAEIAMSLVLLVVAGLTLRSLNALQTFDLGFDVDRLVTASISVPRSRSANGEAPALYFRELEERLRSVPGVSSVASTSSVMLDPTNKQSMSIPFFVEGLPPEAQPKNLQLQADYVSAGYFATVGVPLLDGADFDATDTDEGDSPPVVVNAAMARRFWPGESAVGKRFKFDDPNFPSPWFTVKGVVADTFRQGPGVPAGPEVFLAGYNSWAQIVLRTDGDPASLVGPVRDAIGGETPPPVRTMEEVLARELAERRFVTELLAVFAAVALAIAAIGVFGVMSYLVSQRTNEIGIRMALGAQPVDILRSVLVESWLVTMAGLAVGLALAVAVTRLLGSVLFGVGPLDPLTFTVLTAGLALVATTASYLPARAASRVDAMEALRAE